MTGEGGGIAGEAVARRGGAAPEVAGLGAATPAPAALADCTDTADRLAWVCRVTDGRVERRRLAADKVQLRLHLPSGEVWAAEAATTGAAVDSLVARAEAREVAE